MQGNGDYGSDDRINPILGFWYKQFKSSSGTSGQIIIKSDLDMYLKFVSIVQPLGYIVKRETDFNNVFSKIRADKKNEVKMIIFQLDQKSTWEICGCTLKIRQIKGEKRLPIVAYGIKAFPDKDMADDDITIPFFRAGGNLIHIEKYPGSPAEQFYIVKMLNEWIV